MQCVVTVAIKRLMRKLSMTKTYSELLTLPTFEERFEYLKLGGQVGADTFGFDRYLNQVFYRSREWRSIKDRVIIRDNGCDMALEDCEIPPGDRIYVHHINPITKQDILDRSPKLFDMENLITVCKRTHDGIHYGSLKNTYTTFKERSPNDTCPWRN